MQLVVQLHRQASRALCGARHAGNDEQCTVALQDFAVLSAFARDVATAQGSIRCSFCHVTL